MSILLEQHVTEFTYPTPFELHYSEVHKEKYQKDDTYICGDTEDTDLATHIVVTYHRGISLYGKQMNEVFIPIDRHYYINSIINDVDEAIQYITNNPVYYSLNLTEIREELKSQPIHPKI